MHYLTKGSRENVSIIYAGKRIQVSTSETWANNREGERECEIDESNSTSLGVAMSEKGKRNGGRDIRFLSVPLANCEAERAREHPTCWLGMGFQTPLLDRFRRLPHLGYMNMVDTDPTDIGGTGKT